MYFTLILYTQLLSLSQVTIGKLSAGHVINLASNDVHRFDLVSVNSIAQLLYIIMCSAYYIAKSFFICIVLYLHSGSVILSLCVDCSFSIWPLLLSHLQ